MANLARQGRSRDPFLAKADLEWVDMGSILSRVLRSNKQYTMQSTEIE